MDAAPLPCRAQHPGDGRLDAFVGIGDDELDAAQAATGQLAQELRPDRLGLRGANLHAQHLAPAVRIDADSDDDGDRDDPPTAADLQVSGVDPQVWPIALNRPLEEGLHLAVDLLAQPRDLALGDAAHPHGLDQVVDRAGRDGLDVGLLDDGGQRLLGHAARFEETWGVGAFPELRDAQFDGAGARLPVPVAVAIALGEPQRILLAIGAPVAAPTSSSISRSATKPIISRKRSESGVFSTSARRFIMSSVIDGSFESGWCQQPDLTGELSMTTAKPLARYSAIKGALANGFTTAELHHLWGHDPLARLNEHRRLAAAFRNCVNFDFAKSKTAFGGSSSPSSSIGGARLLCEQSKPSVTPSAKSSARHFNRMQELLHRGRLMRQPNFISL
ncbi:hypothetical protein A9174_31985 [Mesorhizobium loti NZP2037]|nr:hypothetical protein A9174_31985 [Mesorhizobium loti NZP2037]